MSPKGLVDAAPAAAKASPFENNKSSFFLMSRQEAPQGQDYIKVWLKDATYIKDSLFRFVKWSADFKSGAEPSIVPMWIQFPNLLPICFFQDDYLRSIANVVSKVLLIDGPTPGLSRPSVARVCVEVDLLKKNPNRFWLNMGQYEGRWQKIVYEKDLRGIGNIKSRRRVVKLVKMYNISLISILEPLHHANKIQEFSNRMGFHFSLANQEADEKIWLSWNHEVNVVLVDAFEQCITVDIGFLNSDLVRLTIVYAKCSIQRLLCKYTWSNNQEGGGFVWARLDRVFTNPAWADVFSSTMVKDLPRSTSDPSPMLIQIDEGLHRAFRSRANSRQSVNVSEAGSPDLLTDIFLYLTYSFLHNHRDVSSAGDESKRESHLRLRACLSFFV
ncbi:hypothetical protein RHMOL_RhmolMtG0012200 (mitochondrion) [Rhododendron molle]|nr:hypothetical protein RHMOL_RhmolMtG0012200 [Rhododendron molle]